MEHQSLIKVFGNGPAAMLTSQLLARHYDCVQLLRPEHRSVVDHPIVINTRMQILLEELCPGFLRTLPEAQYSKFSHADILKNRFAESASDLTDEDYSESFISLSNATFCRHIESQLSLSKNIDVLSTAMIRPNTNGAELFFDASGVPVKAIERAGQSYVCLRKSYFSAANAPFFQVFSSQSCRGGVYPQGEKFDICFFLLERIFEQFQTAESAFSFCLDQHAPSKNLELVSASASELFLIKGLESYISPFYQAEEHRYANNIFLVGQSYIFSQPSYSRGLVVLERQLRAVMTGLLATGVRSRCDRIYDELSSVDQIVRQDWKDLTFKDNAEKKGLALKPLVSRAAGVLYRSLMWPLEQADLKYYRRVLSYFQDRRSLREVVDIKSLFAGIIHLLMRYRAPEVAQIFFVSVFGVSEIHSGSNKNLFFVLMAILFHVLSAYLINDYADHELDLLNPRKKFISNPRNKAVAFGFATVFSLLSAALVSTKFMLAVAVLNMISFVYSARPFRLKEKVGFSLILHFLMGVLYILVPIIGLKTPFSEGMLLIALAFGVILSSASLLNEYIDAEADRSGGIATLGQKFHSTNQVWPFYFMHSLAFILLLSYHVLQSNEAAAIISVAALIIYQAVFIALVKQRSFATFRNRYRWLFGFCLTACLFL